MTKGEFQKEVADDFITLQKQMTRWRSAMEYWTDQTKSGDSTTRTWKSPRGNTWVIQYFRIGPRTNVSYFTWVESQYGRYIVKPQLTDIGYTISIFIPHFFRRYRERMKLGSKMSTLQLVKRFMKNNKTAHSQNHGKSREVAYHEGIGLGNIIAPRQLLMNTFITFDMAYGGQVRRFDKSIERRKAVCDPRVIYSDEVQKELREFGMTDKEILEQLIEKEKEKQEQDNNNQTNQKEK